MPKEKEKSNVALKKESGGGFCAGIGQQVWHEPVEKLSQDYTKPSAKKASH